MAGRIEERSKNRWRLTVSGGFDETGKRIRHTKTITAFSRHEAEKELAKFVTDIERKLVAVKKETLEAFVLDWWDKYAKPNLSPNTKERYKSLLNLYILPALGHLKLEQIEPKHLVKFYNMLQEDGIRHDNKPGGLSARTITHCYKLLSAILETAIQWQYLTVNPTRRVKPPKIEQKQLDCYTEEQVIKIMQCLSQEDIQHQAIINLAIATGMRRGELMALEWEDIDWENKTIEISKSVNTINGIRVTKSPKNGKFRTITVPDRVLKILKEHKKQKGVARLNLGAEWQGAKTVFTDNLGNPMYPEHISKYWQRFTKRNNLPYIRFHSLRHTSATLLIAQGVHAKTISSRLGHSDISITMDIYGHALERADREAANKLDIYFAEK